MSDVLSNIQERGEQNRLNLKLNAQLQEQLVQQRAVARQRLLAQNVAVQSATKNAQVQSKLAVINANSQADAVRAQQRLQLLQTRAQVRATQTGRGASARSTATGLRLASKIAARPTWVDRLNERIDRLPTPGGLFALFIILLVFVFLIVPVSATGQTRFELFWLTLLGRTKLDSTGGGEPGATGGNGSGNGGNGGSDPLQEKTPALSEHGDSSNGLAAVVNVSQLTALPIPPFGLPGMGGSRG